jgi:hypothetical protein
MRIKTNYDGWRRICKPQEMGPFPKLSHKISCNRIGGAIWKIVPPSGKLNRELVIFDMLAALQFDHITRDFGFFAQGGAFGVTVAAVFDRLRQQVITPRR